MVVGSYFKSKMSEKFSLKWIDFHSNVSKSFGLFRNEDYLHDVTLVSDDHKQVSAHKLVLSACSEYFRDIFKQNNKPNAHPLLCLDGISSHDLNKIMDYIYNGEVQIFQENLDRFLAVAQRFKLEGLMESGKGDSQQYISTEQNIAKEEDTEEEALPIHQNYQNPKPRQVANAERVIVPISSDSASEIENMVNQHIERDPAGVYKCKLCGKTTKFLSDMKKHIETHLEGLSYPCQLCGKTYRSKNVLSNHISRSHK